MSENLRKIIRPKPLLVGSEIIVLVVLNLLALVFYGSELFKAVGLSHKGHYLFWTLFLIINHLGLTIIIDSLTHYLTSGYELTKDRLIIVTAKLGRGPKTETVHFNNLASVGDSTKNRLELNVKHTAKPKICRVLQNGHVLCREVKDHLRLHNLSALDDESSLTSSNASLTNTPRFVLVDDEPPNNQTLN